MAEWRGKLPFSDFFQSNAPILHCVAGPAGQVWDREQEKGTETKRNRDTGEKNREGTQTRTQRVRKDMESERMMEDSHIDS